MDWSGSLSCFSYLTRMFDRFLQIIDKCSSEEFERKTVDETVEIYFRKGASEAEKYLTSSKKLSPHKASELISSIERENDYLNKQSIWINGFFLSIMIVAIIGTAPFYLLSIFFGGVAALWLMALIKSIARYLRSKKNRYVPTEAKQ